MLLASGGFAHRPCWGQTLHTLILGLDSVVAMSPHYCQEVYAPPVSSEWLFCVDCEQFVLVSSTNAAIRTQ